MIAFVNHMSTITLSLEIFVIPAVLFIDSLTDTLQVLCWLLGKRVVDAAEVEGFFAFFEVAELEVGDSEAHPACCRVCLDFDGFVEG